MRTKMTLGQTVFTVKRATPNTMPRIVGPMTVEEVTLHRKGEECLVKHVFKTQNGGWRTYGVVDSKRLFPSLRAAARELNRQLSIRAKTL